MNKKILFFVFLCSIVLSQGVVSQDETQGTIWDVYAWMSREDIQAVIDDTSNGDTVYFHTGIYDWRSVPLGERSENTGAIIIIDKTLTIKGEEGALFIGPESENGPHENARGVNAFYVKDLDVDNDVTFDGLNFQTFLRGIAVLYNDNFGGEYDLLLPNLRNLTVVNCKFSDIHRGAITIGQVGGDVLIKKNTILSSGRMGIIIGWIWGQDNRDWQPDDSVVHILENNISSAMYGIYLFKSKNSYVINNIIQDCEEVGIGINHTRGGTVISHNSIIDCNIRGIHIYGDWRGGEEFEAQGALVERNTIVNIKSRGIQFPGDANYGHTVIRNEIIMAPGSNIGISSAAHNCYFGQNKISGSGNTAFVLSGYEYFFSHHDILHANNVDNFAPDFCHFYLSEGTHDNIIIGSGMEYNTYVNHGYNNRITGVTPMAGVIGKELSEGIGNRNEVLRDLKDIEF